MIESLLTTQNVPPYIRTYNILRYFFLSNEEHGTTHIQKPVKVVVILSPHGTGSTERIIWLKPDATEFVSHLSQLFGP